MAHARQNADVISGQPQSGLVASIDWCAPWLKPMRLLGEPVTLQVAAGVSQPDALNRQMQTSLSEAFRPSVWFVSQSKLPADVAYEQHIFDHQQVPTREGLHDFLNGIVWLHFPKTKRRLNQLHVAQITKTGIAPVRGPTRDALTLFDENAALMRAPDALWDALAAKDWSSVFGDLRHLWTESYLVLFGHALLEKLVQPRKSITAHVYRSYPASDSIADLDEWMHTELSAEKLASKPFAHLPVLGVPGWWPANECADFYDDTTVFRAARSTGRTTPI